MTQNGQEITIPTRRTGPSVPSTHTGDHQKTRIYPTFRHIFYRPEEGRKPEFAEGFEEGYLNFKIGIILRQALEQMRATQADVAEKLNTTKSVISRMENYAEDIKLSSLAKYERHW